LKLDSHLNPESQSHLGGNDDGNGDGAFGYNAGDNSGLEYLN